MADTEIPDLTALTGANVNPAADILVINDTDVTTTKKILVEQMAIALEIEGSAVASATSCNIWGVGQTKHITGTTTITDFGTANKAGEWRKLIFDDAVLLTHGANLNIQSGQNYRTKADDLVLVYADTTTQFDVFIVTSGTTAETVTTPVSLTNNTAANVGSGINLTAGVWNVFAASRFSPDANTVITSVIQSISTTSATLDTSIGRSSNNRFGDSTGLTGIKPGNTVGIDLASAAVRVSVASDTTHYLVVRGDFTGGTLTATGKIWAERRS